MSLILSISLFCLVSKRQKLIDKLFHRRPYYYLRCQQAHNIHIDIVTVGVYEILPKTTEKREMLCMSEKLMHTERRGNGKIFPYSESFYVKYLLSMFFRHVRNSTERLGVCVRLTCGGLHKCVSVKFPLSSIEMQSGNKGVSKLHNKSAPPHRQIFSLFFVISPTYIFIYCFEFSFSLEHLIIFLLSRLFIHHFGIHSPSALIPLYYSNVR